LAGQPVKRRRPGLRIPRVAMTALLAGLLATAAGAQTAPVRVGVILKGLDNPFFVTMYEGARAEAARRRVAASFLAAADVDDAEGQAARARTLVRGRHDCYVVNPYSPRSLIRAFRSVKRPVVNVDSPLDRAAARRAGMRIKTYIGTDDAAAGALAAAGMVSALRGRGEVALLAGFADSVNSNLRLRGFTRRVARTKIRIVARVVADYDRTKAQLATRRIVREHPNVAGFFAANDEMALGIADTLRAVGKRGVVRVIGVDAIPAALDAVRAGALTGTVAQYPYVMGRMAIEACIAAARGAKLPARVNAPVVLVTKQNVRRVSAAFPLPPRPYFDPFARLLRGRP
jgi:ribose transport system substrate-binding protein